MVVFRKKQEYQSGITNNRISKKYPELTVAQAYVYDYLLKQSQEVDGERRCRVPGAKIARTLNIADATVVSVIANLVRKKFIEVRKGLHEVKKIPVNIYVLLK